jgi:hypothetical protein
MEAALCEIEKAQAEIDEAFTKLELAQTEETRVAAIEEPKGCSRSGDSNHSTLLK